MVMNLCSPVFHVIQPSIQQLLYKESVVRTQDNSSSLKQWLHKRACCHAFRDLLGSCRTLTLTNIMFLLGLVAELG